MNLLIATLITIFVFAVAYFLFKPRTIYMKVILTNGSWFIGKRGAKEMGYPTNHETRGTHHFTVIECGGANDSVDNNHLEKGSEVAVPINQARYFIIYDKNYKPEKE